MMLKDFMPAPELRDFVQTYRIVHFRFEPGQALPSKAYPPRPEQVLAFYPHDRETVRYHQSGREVRNLPVVLYGQFSEVTTRIIGHHFLVFQIVFLPGAIYRLTGMPSAEITNAYIDAETVFGTRVREVNDQLYHANGYPQMLLVADAFVRSLISTQKKPTLIIDQACAQLLKKEPAGAMQQLARESCLSLRQMERKFKERVGVNPKLFERIIRFDKAFRLKNSFADRDWLRIAMECNYHDYQHLVRDYKEFTGLGPNAFHEIENKAPERSFGLSEQYYRLTD